MYGLRQAVHEILTLRGNARVVNADVRIFCETHGVHKETRTSTFSEVRCLVDTLYFECESCVLREYQALERLHRWCKLEMCLAAAQSAELEQVKSDYELNVRLF